MSDLAQSTAPAPSPFTIARTAWRSAAEHYRRGFAELDAGRQFLLEAAEKIGAAAESREEGEEWDDAVCHAARTGHLDRMAQLLMPATAAWDGADDNLRHLTEEVIELAEAEDVAAVVAEQWKPAPWQEKRRAEQAEAATPPEPDPLAGMVSAWRCYSKMARAAQLGFEAADAVLERDYRNLGIDDEQSCFHAFGEPRLAVLREAKEAGADRLVAAMLTNEYLRSNRLPADEPSMDDRMLDARDFSEFADAAEAGKLADFAIERYSERERMPTGEEPPAAPPAPVTAEEPVDLEAEAQAAIATILATPKAMALPAGRGAHYRHAVKLLRSALDFMHNATAEVREQRPEWLRTGRVGEYEFLDYQQDLVVDLRELAKRIEGFDAAKCFKVSAEDCMESQKGQRLLVDVAVNAVAWHSGE